MKHPKLNRSFFIKSALLCALASPVSADPGVDLDVPLNYGTLTGENLLNQNGAFYQVANAADVIACFKSSEAEVKRNAEKGLRNLTFFVRKPLEGLLKSTQMETALESKVLKKFLKLSVEKGNSLNTEKAHNILTNKHTPFQEDRYYLVYRGISVGKALSKGKVFVCPINFKASAVSCAVKK